MSNDTPISNTVKNWGYRDLLTQLAVEAWIKRNEDAGDIAPFPTAKTSGVQGKHVVLRWQNEMVAIYEIFGDPPKLKWIAPSDKLLANLENIPTEW